jgi:Chaperone of endosialidase
VAGWLVKAKVPKTAAAAKAASHAASKAASNAASNAASHVAIPSDIRLKQDITAVGRTPDGLHLYRYRYIGDDVFYVGVMAQEVAECEPDAVMRGKDGYLRVDYDKLGLRLLTFEDWTRRQAANREN